MPLVPSPDEPPQGGGSDENDERGDETFLAQSSPPFPGLPWLQPAARRVYAITAGAQPQLIGITSDQARPAKSAAASRPWPRQRASDTWRACVETLAPGRDAIPWPGVRAPERGWLVVRGRRGHYHFCDEFRIYSLATGAAYIARSCSALLLQSNGGVNQARTNAARTPQTVRGTVSLDNLREAAWMMRLVDHVQKP